MANIFDRTSYTTVNGRELHRTSDETIEENAVFAIHQISWEGAYADCKAARDEHYCNELVTNDDAFLSVHSGQEGMDKVITNISLRKKVAGRGTVVFTVKGYFRGYEGNLDFERVDKNILTWRALCKENVPILDQVRNWQKMLDLGRLDLYSEYKYVTESGGTVEITDEPTKKLCQMIFRGVESYPEYYPVLNISVSFAKHPAELGISGFVAGSLLGKVVKSPDMIPSGYSVPIGSTSSASSPQTDFDNVAGNFILCNGDKLQCNGDGSYTLNRSFMKLRQMEPDLYLGAGGLSPYDDAQNDKQLYPQGY